MIIKRDNKKEKGGEERIGGGFGESRRCRATYSHQIPLYSLFSSYLYQPP